MNPSKMNVSKIARIILAILFACFIGIASLVLISPRANAQHSRRYYAKQGLHAPNKKLMRHVTYRKWVKSQKRNKRTRITYRQWIKSQVCPKLSNRKKR